MKYKDPKVLLLRATMKTQKIYPQNSQILLENKKAHQIAITQKKDHILSKPSLQNRQKQGKRESICLLRISRK